MPITTEICVAELNKRFPAHYGKNAGDWKRMSKKGPKTGIITRVFHHRTLPLQATVLECGGAITSVEFAPLGEATAGATIDSSIAAADAVPVTAACSEAANQFLFAMGSPWEAGSGRRHFTVCPEAYWREHRCLSDSLDMTVLEPLLPQGWGRESEAFFTTTLSRAKLGGFLLSQGFKEDSDFSEYVHNL